MRESSRFASHSRTRAASSATRPGRSRPIAERMNQRRMGPPSVAGSGRGHRERRIAREAAGPGPRARSARSGPPARCAGRAPARQLPQSPGSGAPRRPAPPVYNRAREPPPRSPRPPRAHPGPRRARRSPSWWESPSTRGPSSASAPSAGRCGADAGAWLPIAEPQAFELDDLVGVVAPPGAPGAQHRAVRARAARAPRRCSTASGAPASPRRCAGCSRASATRGLRLVEVHRDDLLQLPEILDALRGLPWRFLLFADDLSFSEGETRLPGAEGGPRGQPRGAARERAHRGHEQPAPSAPGAARREPRGRASTRTASCTSARPSRRSSPSRTASASCSASTASTRRPTSRSSSAGPRRPASRSPAAALREEALRFALERSSRSGRTARQFVDDLAGREALAARKAKAG